MKEFFLLLLIPAIRFIVNIHNYWYLYQVIRTHDVWSQGISKTASPIDKQKASEAAKWIQAQTSQINRVVQLSGREAPVKSFMHPIGFNHVQQKQMNLLDNLLFPNQEVLSEARNVLKIAEGHFYTNAISSLNPIFWLETIFFLPRSIASASGIELTNKLTQLVVNVLQIFYWMAVIFVILLKPELLDVILDQKPEK